MKKYSFIIVFGIVSIAFVLGCSSNSEQTPPASRTVLVEGKKIRVVVIEGCEYFSTQTYLGYITLAHKGNCTNDCHMRIK